MKQYITEAQFNELNKEQKSIWYKFCRKNKHVLFDKGQDDFMIKDFPNIGEMIGFLENGNNLIIYNLPQDFSWNIEINKMPNILLTLFCSAPSLI